MNSSCREDNNLSYYFFNVVLPIYPLSIDLLAHRTWDYLIRKLIFFSSKLKISASDPLHFGCCKRKLQHDLFKNMFVENAIAGLLFFFFCELPTLQNL